MNNYLLHIINRSWSRPRSEQPTPQQDIGPITKNSLNNFFTAEEDPFEAETTPTLPGDLEDASTPVLPLIFEPNKANASPKNVEPPLNQPSSGQVMPQQDIGPMTKNSRNDFFSEEEDPFKAEIPGPLLEKEEELLKNEVKKDMLPIRKPEIAEPARTDAGRVFPGENKRMATPYLPDIPTQKEPIVAESRGTIQPSPAQVFDGNKSVLTKKQPEERHEGMIDNPLAEKVLPGSAKTAQVSPQVPHPITNTKVPAAEQKTAQPSPFLPQKDMQTKEWLSKTIQPDQTERRPVLPLAPMPLAALGNTESKSRLVIGELKVEVVHATPVEQIKTQAPEIRIVKTASPAPARNTRGSGLKVQFGLGQI